MKVTVITGCAGFIGTNLSLKLLKKGENILGIDNLSSGSERNLKILRKYKNFEFLKKDVSKKIKIEYKNIDKIFHLASMASPKFYQRYPLETLKTNFTGTLNMLEVAKKTKSKFIFSSTSEIYGDPLVHPQSENYWGNVNPIGIRSCYDEGKRVAETLTFEYFRNFKVKVKVCRIFNTYGKFMSKDDGRVVSNFIVQALKNEDITVYGDGNQTRSFCHIDDLLNGLISLSDSKDDFTGPVNLGSEEEIKIIDLAKMVIKLTGSQSKIVFKDLPKDDPVKRKPDLSLAKKVLKYKNSVPIEMGILETIEYFRGAL
ncbi:MAG: NAD-dependent epimerase/dehydratase family protein [candidate division TA06 bacterium 32_111]|uniref:NAD-dependent epimerase/dehydratase family protein n=1 Tax=candidate division TA06 bacterium 34_109 TaxID=1635277 RepID=A0A101I2C8_UNCT6|nr:MAG: NAD-dependent epimerase/dehydratase family protein [candidate division TA06 bacterium 32_111]KUK87496.1 MAG: NAD-dependent epimerase/dehydratase family protein [candidate division TA06 bacterium 34_109]